MLLLTNILLPLCIFDFPQKLDFERIMNLNLKLESNATGAVPVIFLDCS